jgi:phage tail-like protein
MPVTSPGALQDAEYIGSWFTIELDNGIEGFFTDASGLVIEMEVVEKTDTGTTGDTLTRKRPGTTKYSEITLKRTLSPDKKFRTKGAVVLHDISGAESGRWTFENAWPSKWSASDLDVGTDDLMQEEVTLQVELLKRES